MSGNLDAALEAIDRVLDVGDQHTTPDHWGENAQGDRRGYWEVVEEGYRPQPRLLHRVLAWLQRHSWFWWRHKPSWIWTAHTYTIRRWVPADDQPPCESCGTRSDLELRDGSFWCLSCDAAARDLGYDDEPIVTYR